MIIDNLGSKSSRTRNRTAAADIDAGLIYKANDVDQQTRHFIMFRPTAYEFAFISLCIEGFFCGVYSGIFVIYLQHQVNRKDTNNSQNVIFYSICILYVLSVSLFVSDIALMAFEILEGSVTDTLHIGIVQSTLFGCCDFIAQLILIYRCWIVWSRNIRVVIIPCILTFAFLVIWLLSGSFMLREIVVPYWTAPMLLLGLALSLAVNALVMGLIIFRIFKVFREVRATSDNQILGATGGSKLRGVIFILIESGTALFVIQVVRLVLSLVGGEEITIIIGIHQMLNGLKTTFILVPSSMGLTYDEDGSMEEVAIGSLRFASNHANSVPETGSTNVVVDQDRRDDDEIGIRQENDIEVVDR